MHSIGCEEQYLGITIKVILAGSRKENKYHEKRPNRLGSLLAVRCMGHSLILHTRTVILH